MSGVSSYESSTQTVLATSANLLIETNQKRLTRMPIARQSERVGAHIDTFKTIQKKCLPERLGRKTLQVIGLQEVQVGDGVHCGEEIQRALRFNHGTWQPHSRLSTGEHIGIISNILPDSSECIELDTNRYALSLQFGNLAVINCHPMFSDAKRRKKQFDTLFEYTSNFDQTIVLGDFNEDPALLFRFFGSQSRHRLGRTGLASAFVKSKGYHPITLPSSEYTKSRSPLVRAGLLAVGGGLCYDDIYTSENIATSSCGTIETASDHRFVYAKLRVPQFAAPSL